MFSDAAGIACVAASGPVERAVIWKLLPRALELLAELIPANLRTFIAHSRAKNRSAIYHGH